MLSPQNQQKKRNKQKMQPATSSKEDEVFELLNQSSSVLHSLSHTLGYFEEKKVPPKLLVMVAIEYEARGLDGLMDYLSSIVEKNINEVEQDVNRISTDQRRRLDVIMAKREAKAESTPRPEPKERKLFREYLEAQSDLRQAEAWRCMLQFVDKEISARRKDLQDMQSVKNRIGESFKSEYRKGNLVDLARALPSKTDIDERLQILEQKLTEAEQEPKPKPKPKATPARKRAKKE